MDLRSIFIQKPLIQIIRNALRSAAQTLCAFCFIVDGLTFDLVSFTLRTYKNTL